MPTYVYVCPCGHEEIVIHGITAEPVVKCGECFDCVMTRKPSLAGVSFNGDGWGKD